MSRIHAIHDLFAAYGYIDAQMDGQSLEITAGDGVHAPLVKPRLIATRADPTERAVITHVCDNGLLGFVAMDAIEPGVPRLRAVARAGSDADFTPSRDDAHALNLSGAQVRTALHHLLEPITKFINDELADLCATACETYDRARAAGPGTLQYRTNEGAREVLVYAGNDPDGAALPYTWEALCILADGERYSGVLRCFVSEAEELLCEVMVRYQACTHTQLEAMSQTLADEVLASLRRDGRAFTGWPLTVAGRRNAPLALLARYPVLFETLEEDAPPGIAAYSRLVRAPANAYEWQAPTREIWVVESPAHNLRAVVQRLEDGSGSFERYDSDETLCEAFDSLVQDIEDQGWLVREHTPYGFYNSTAYDARSRAFAQVPRLQQKREATERLAATREAIRTAGGAQGAAQLFD